MSECLDSTLAKDYVLFSLAGKLLAISSDALVEVLEPIPVSALPLVPSYIDGLVNLSGDIIPQINLQLFLQDIFDETSFSADHDSATLLVVSVAGQLIALNVGMIQEPLQLLDDDLEEVSDKACYSACFSYQHSRINILSLASLQGIVKPSAQPAGKRSFLGDVAEQEDSTESLKEYLYVRCADQVYAMLLSDIYEVVDGQQRLTTLILLLKHLVIAALKTLFVLEMS